MITPDTFLADNLKSYKYARDVTKDVKCALSAYNELRLKVENFTFNDGRSNNLVCLNGTIPVVYCEQTYNIPIAIFVQESHPHTAPIVYVRPTSTMEIAPSYFVDNTGLVKLPYLSDWKHPESDLVGLLQVLQVTFGEKSPVFAKAPTAQPLPNLPQSVGGASHSGTYFPLPPMPMTDGFGLTTPPVLGMGWQMPQLPPIMPVPLRMNYINPIPEPAVSYTTGGPGSAAGPIGLAVGATPPTFNPNRSGVPEDQLIQSVRSAVLDKLRRCQRELLMQYRDEIQSLQETQSDLVRGGALLAEMLSRMDREKSQATEALQMTSQRNGELSELLDRLTTNEKQPVNVDEAVDTTFPLYRQLVSSFAEEQAIEDAVYYLGDALGKGALDLESFLKVVHEFY
ncbi:hypothetical protein FBUS_05949 [Fasciolopsis buskii]|uniref:Tumor susceptibility protein 101 n=1 Tax=Fasciolopsis buskii TaxID=27845 RepID=A0A8E0RW79_9TREM|nr:hypothetical protein FBUS_05949 [Fasciolopsis buski]